MAVELKRKHLQEDKRSYIWERDSAVGLKTALV